MNKKESRINDLHGSKVLCSTSEKWSPVSLNSSTNSLSLGQVLSVFNESITEEHAWAIIYECCRTLEEILKTAKNTIYIVDSVDEIILQRDGRIQGNTFLSPTFGEGTQRKLASSVDKAISQLGEVIYTVLDYGLTNEDERELTPELENLLCAMTSADGNLRIVEEEESEGEEERIETDDEGIEQDHDDDVKDITDGGLLSNFKSLKHIMYLCSNHLSVSKEASHHYKNVCRALFSEAIELSSFMEKIQESNKNNAHAKEIQELALLDWAHLWKETMLQLRQGVKLKKMNYNKTPYEYTLTPYEILMDDIRSRRYKLNKVMVNGDLPPKVKKDAHDIILNFIRSRPPLKPVSQRTLPPIKLDTTPKELLLQSICSPSAKASLKKTPGPKILEGSCTKSSFSSLSKKLSAPANMSSSTKRVIHPDPDFLLFNDEDEDDDTFAPLDFKRNRVIGGSLLNLSNENRRRRSSIPNVVVSSPGWLPLTEKPKSPPSFFEEFFSGSENISPILLPSNTSTQFNKHNHNHNNNNKHPPNTTTTTNHNSRRASSYITSSPSITNDCPVKHDWTLLNNVELNLKEFSHIRRVHTKADIENRAIDSQQKQDLEKSKMCFLCMKSHFGIFVWSYTCKLCHQSVCSSCLTKITIPNNDWAFISVLSLSLVNIELMEKHKMLYRRSFMNSPSSPLSSSSNFKFNSNNNNHRNQLNKIHSLDVEKEREFESLSSASTSPHSNKSRLKRSNTLKCDRKTEEKKRIDNCQINICSECKNVLFQAFRSHSRSNNLNRRQLFTRSLCLN